MEFAALIAYAIGVENSMYLTTTTKSMKMMMNFTNIGTIFKTFTWWGF